MFSKGRIYPDGRVVLYRPEEVLANVRNPRTAWVQGERVPLARVEQVIDERYLSLLERERLKDLVTAGTSIRQIALAMGRSPSTISRELRRNTVAPGGYLPHTAHRLSVKRRERPRTAKLAREGPLREYVAGKLKKRWSPEQITHRLRREFPYDPGMRVSCETIYQAIYVHAHGELKRELARSLRRGRSRRKPHRDPQARTSRFTDPMTPLSERPVEVEDRAVPGHWEGDLILGAGSRSAVATLVERTTRYLVLGHLPVERTAEAVRDSIVAALAELSTGLRRTLTWDQGAEMSEHRTFTMATDMAVYFCEPASPWQRGTNENTNGLLRQYLDPPDVAEGLQGRRPGRGGGGGLLEGHASRLGGQVALRDGGVLCESSGPCAEHGVPDLEARHVPADGRHCPGDVEPRHGALRCTQA